MFYQYLQNFTFCDNDTVRWLLFLPLVEFTKKNHTLVPIHGIHTSMILFHSMPIVQLTFICFNHIDKECKRFLFNNWNGLKMSHHTLKVE